jgi:hypothetical protein
VERHTRISGAATSEDQTKSRAIAAARDAMAQPAKATSQAGDVITTGIHLLQAKAVEDAWNTKVQDQVKEMDTNLITKIHGSKAALFLEGCEGTQSPKKSAKKKKKKLKGTQASILTLNKKSDSQGGRESMSKATFLSIKHTHKMGTGSDEPGIDTLLKRKTQKKGMPLLEKSCHMKCSVASSSQDCAAHKLHIMELGGGRNVEASLEMFGEDSVVEVSDFNPVLPAVHNFKGISHSNSKCREHCNLSETRTVGPGWAVHHLSCFTGCHIKCLLY